MKIATATEVKNRFGEFLEEARNEPVVISKTGRKAGVLLSWAEFERLIALEDKWWAKRAKDAERKGYLGPDATERFIRKRMNEKA